MIGRFFFLFIYKLYEFWQVLNVIYDYTKFSMGVKLYTR